MLPSNSLKGLWRCVRGSPSRLFQATSTRLVTNPPTTLTREDGDPFGVIYKPPTYPIQEELSDSIRCSISGYNQADHEYYTRDTGMSIIFLGTSAGIPTKTRSTSSTLLRMGGSSFLFDAGEGVQRQLAFTRAKPSQIEHIFITHLHGDHIFGLPGFLLGLQHSIMLMQNDNGKSKKKRRSVKNHVVKIYGPPGIYNYIAANIVLSCTSFHSISVEVHELVGGRVRRRHGGKGIRNPFADSYPEFNFGFLKRKYVNCQDGVWTINDLQKHTREEVLSQSMRTGQRNVRIQAAEVDHLSGIATFGFVVQEDEPARNIDAEKAQSLGVSPKGKKYELLKHGFSVQTDDGSAEVMPRQVLKPPTKMARKVTIVGDNRGWTPQLKQLAKDSDVLIHEATLSEEDWSRGHSTADMAGKLSAQVNSQVMILNHISSKSDQVDEDGNSRQLELIDAANKGSDGQAKVVVAYDFMEMLVPWMGFGPKPVENTESSNSEDTNETEPASARTAVKKWFRNEESNKNEGTNES